MTSHVSSALSTLPNIGQNHQVSSNLTSFWQFLCKEVVKKTITELMCDVIKKVAPRFLWNYDFTSDVHVQYLSDNTDRWKQWMFKKKTWGNIHLESVVSTSWKLESEGLSSCNIPLLCLKVILFYSKHIFNLMLWAGKGTQIIFAMESLRSLLWENDKWY